MSSRSDLDKSFIKNFRATMHKASSREKKYQQHNLLLGRGEENLESYNNINSNTEKPVTVSELKPESLTYFYTSILHGWWQLKRPRHNSATGCSKCPHLYWFYRQLRLKMLHPTHFSICMCVLALFQRNQRNILLLLRELQHSSGSSYVSSKTGTSYSFFCVFLNTALVTAGYCIHSGSLKV